MTQISAQELDRVFDVTEGANVRISEVTIRGGKTPPVDQEPNAGGGIRTAGVLTLDSIVLTDNEAGAWGGGVASGLNGGLTILNSTISENSATSGGGIHSASLNPREVTIAGSIVVRNSASGDGGGLYMAIDADVKRTVFRDNTAGGNGGGIHAGGSYVVTDVRIERNIAANGAGLYQGAFYSQFFIRTLNRVTIAENRAEGTGTNEGGGIWVGGNAVRLSNSTVRGNSAELGGGVFNLSRLSLSGNQFAVLAVSRTAITGNTAGDGDGLYNVGGVNPAGANVTSTTVSGNGSPGSGGRGGGIFNGSAAELTVTNATITGNAASLNAGDGGNIYNAGMINARDTIVHEALSSGNCGGTALADLGNNLDYAQLSAQPCFTTSGDPKLGPLENNGGPTKTHAIAADSAARNAGANCDAIDQRGVPRSLGGVCDIGAYERVLCLGGLVNRVGTPNKDRFIGTNANEVYLGLGGNDFARPGSGADRVCMGGGNDTADLRDGRGTDRADGQAGTRDRVLRNSGDRVTGFERFG